jgi:enterochelin esterase-like enzyme
VNVPRLDGEFSFARVCARSQIDNRGEKSVKILHTRSGRWAAFALTAVLASAGLATTAVPAQAADTGSVNVDLSGTWKFIKGDDAAYSATTYDDSAWMDLTVPEDGSQWASYDGFGWYRLTFDLPSDAAGKNLVASLGFIDDVDEAYLNGVKIGSSGSMPPNADSQWFEKRLYPVPASAPVFGGKNTLAVRVYDINGGGGWYKGPIGIYSKDQVRENVYGITGDVAPASVGAAVQAVLDQQKSALAAGDIDAYLATLDSSYVHDGRDKAQRKAQLETWLAASDSSLTLSDGEVEVVQATDGRLLADTNRSIVGTKNGSPYTFQAKTQEFLSFNPTTYKEIGNHSRFFRETIDSAVEGKQREFMVYMPPSYYTEPNRKFPVVYLLHGINGGSREWEPREMDKKLDALSADKNIAQSIVIMPDGESLWYVDSTADKWRTMFLNEMMPQVDGQYRTLADPKFRGLSGVSMGGFGAWSIGLEHPELFSSIASHIGALSFGMGGKPTPLVQAAGMTTEQLSKFSYYFDACEDDEYRFDNAARTMDTTLTSKGVAHTWIVYPTGHHNDDCWLPRIDSSFGMHSDHWRAEGLQEDWVAPAIALDYGTASPSDAGWYRSLTVTATATDAVDTAPVLEYNLDGAGWLAYTAGVVIPDGAHSLVIRATDASGNTDSTTVNLKVDSEAPVSSAKLNASDRTVTLKGADALSGLDSLEYRTGDTWTAYTAPIHIADVETTVEYRATDKAGNVESTNSVTVPAAGTMLKSTITASALKYATRTYGGANAVSVKVAGVGGVPSGDVRVLADGVLVGSATLGAAGSATIAISGTALAVGTHELTVQYLGDVTFAASTDTVTVKVVRVDTAVHAALVKSTISSGSRAKVTVQVAAEGTRVAGVVTVSTGGRVLASVASVAGKRITITLPKLKRGAHTLTVSFGHSDNALSSSKKLVLKVK